MGSRAYIAKFERDGTGKFIYLGHGCTPSDAGIKLLTHFSEPDQIDALIAGGSTIRIGNSIQDTDTYYDDEQEWEHCKPTKIQGGTGPFFESPYIPGPEWLYAWTPDGWLAAKVKAQPPANYQLNAVKLEPREFEEWFDNNQEPEWIEWRRQAREDQRPQPLATIIGRYNPLTD